MSAEMRRSSINGVSWRKVSFMVVCVCETRHCSPLLLGLGIVKSYQSPFIADSSVCFTYFFASNRLGHCFLFKLPFILLGLEHVSVFSKLLLFKHHHQQEDGLIDYAGMSHHAT